jgi:hypothetical protein
MSFSLATRVEDFSEAARERDMQREKGNNIKIYTNVQLQQQQQHSSWPRRKFTS